MPTPIEFISEIIARIATAHQLDILHISIIDLLDMMKEGEIDLILEQPKKTALQKAAFIAKLIDSVESPELKEALMKELKSGELDFFREKYLRDLLESLQKEAEKIATVKLTVAVEFKKADIAAMTALLAKKFGRRVAMDLTVERSLIAGAIIQHGSYITDYSVKTRLEHFRSTWKAATKEAA
jgi:F-type H+-transporting ATPase subunit delta